MPRTLAAALTVVSSRPSEFRTSGGGDLEALALGVPTDALPGPPPAELESLSKGANGVLELSRLKEWEAAAATIGRMNTAWATLVTGNPPPLIAARLTKNLDALTEAVKTRKAARTAQKAIDVSQSVLDLELRHRAQSRIDAQRLYLWTQQLRVDAAADAKNLRAAADHAARLGARLRALARA